EAAAVEQLGQRVVVGQVLQLGLEALALRDVADDRRDHDLVVGAQRADRDVDGELGAVAALAPQLEAHAQGGAALAAGGEDLGEALGDDAARALGEQLLDRTAADQLAILAE